MDHLMTSSLAAGCTACSGRLSGTKGLQRQVVECTGLQLSHWLPLFNESYQKQLALTFKEKFRIQ